MVKYAVHLYRHNVSSDIYEKIHPGLEYCKEYLNDPAGAHDETFAMMIAFVRGYEIGLHFAILLTLIMAS